MRLVLDTNVVVAGLLWHGAPRRLLDRAIEDETLQLFSGPALMDELANTLSYEKFVPRIARYETSVGELLAQYEALVSLVSPTHTPRVVADDADDDQVLACAIAAGADLIVSGDKHLHGLGGQYNGIRIVTPAEAVRIIEAG